MGYFVYLIHFQTLLMVYPSYQYPHFFKFYKESQCSAHFCHCTLFLQVYFLAD